MNSIPTPPATHPKEESVLEEGDNLLKRDIVSLLDELNILSTHIPDGKRDEGQREIRLLSWDYGMLKNKELTPDGIAQAKQILERLTSIRKEWGAELK